MRSSVRQFAGLMLIAPAGTLILVLFVYPLGLSLAGAFGPSHEGGYPAPFGRFQNAISLYADDVVFTVLVIAISVAIIAVLAVAIAGYLTLGASPWAVALLRWLYRWPLFIPFIVAAQAMRGFLARNGLMNNALVELGLMTPLSVQSFLDWRGIVVTMVWKQLPFVVLLVAGAMAALDRSTIEAARNLGASRARCLIDIVLPQVRATFAVALVLSTVVMSGVLSVPLMISAQSPTMITAQMAFRVNAYGDYGTANALGLISYLLTGAVAWIYLRQGMRDRR